MTDISHPSVVERYFTPRFRTDVNKTPGEDLQILTHTNKISLITLAPSHPILRDGKTVKKVDFQVDKHTNRLENKVTGKSKRGAQNMSLTAPLCRVICSDESLYTIPACMKGSLVEVNENLVKHPELLTQKPSTEGYFAIVLTHLQDHEAAMAKLQTHDQYEAQLRQRRQTDLNGAASQKDFPSGHPHQLPVVSSKHTTNIDPKPGPAAESAPDKATPDTMECTLTDEPPAKLQKIDTN